MKWAQDERGEMQLTPAADTITFFPKLLSLPRGASRTIGVGTTAGAFGPTEGTYRIFVEEPPDNSAPSDRGTVAIRTKTGIPVFLRPAKATATAEIAGASFEEGRVVTRLRNTGTVHLIVDAVKMRGTASSGLPLSRRKGTQDSRDAGDVRPHAGRSHSSLRAHRRPDRGLPRRGGP
jgi:P pilus assembly chaperone PapD